MFYLLGLHSLLCLGLLVSRVKTTWVKTVKTNSQPAAQQQQHAACGSARLRSAAAALHEDAWLVAPRRPAAGGMQQQVHRSGRSLLMVP
eukprot:COSAG01_NODE_5061_length_4518_cov_17.546277_7_plen_89_part_00